jgi:glycosyltransferase involved in cell wall biosynthesis
LIESQKNVKTYLKVNMNPIYTFVILTYNEEIHLSRLLKSISELNAMTYIIDSGSTDETINIARAFGAQVLYNRFENHPKQWDFALTNINFLTPWVVGLDADQIVSPSLLRSLKTFNDSNKEINGVYFNRHNYFKGKRLKFGGYRNKYLLKMFKVDKGHSDLNENMDHRFIVEGKTIIWKDAVLIEENLKENDISFWINKHNRYSDLLAEEEVERIKKLRNQTINPKILGSPDQRIAWFKSIWWNLPIYWRPLIYFFYRFIFRLGFLESKQGRLFHFLQAFWFRIIVDVKIEEILNKSKTGHQNSII